MRQTAKDGLCEITRDFGVSAHPEPHRSPKRIWRSRLFIAAMQ
jgi:hypothetical protein